MGGALNTPVTLGVGNNPAIIWTGNQLRAAYQDDTGDYHVQYSADRGANWNGQ
jgi:hypothetical protein